MNTLMSQRSADEAWKLYNKYLNEWDTKLSFDSLKEKGLINCYSEWRSIKTAFYYKPVTPDIIYKWLKNQRGQFRVSYLSHILISGYYRNNMSLASSSYIPLDIENIIISYFNFIFIKLYNDSNSDHYELRTFDTNFTINNLTKILEIENNPNQYKNCKRIFSRFGALRFLYSIQKNDKKIYPESTEKNDDNRWVEIPDDIYSNLTIKQIDNELKYDEILEIGVDTLNKTYFDRNICSERWTFNTKKDNNYKLNYNRFEWLCSLQIGDIINICNKYGIWMEGYIKYRDYDTFYIHCIGDDHRSIKSSEEEIKSVGINNLNRLQKRYSFCKWSGLSNIRKTNRLVLCDWITAFTANSTYYPILIE